MPSTGTPKLGMIFEGGLVILPVQHRKWKLTGACHFPVKEKQIQDLNSSWATSRSGEQELL